MMENCFVVGKKIHTLEMGIESWCALFSVYPIHYLKIFQCFLFEKSQFLHQHGYACFLCAFSIKHLSSVQLLNCV